MQPVRVFFLENEVLIDTIPAPFIAGSLVATMNGGNVEIRRVQSSFVFAAIPWTAVADESGATFGSPDAVMAYLAGEFAKRRAVGDRVSVQIAIASRGQKFIPFGDAPTSLLTVRLIVNGAEYRAPDIVVSATAVTWAGSFDLEPSDLVYLVYA